MLFDALYYDQAEKLSLHTWSLTYYWAKKSALQFPNCTSHKLNHIGLPPWWVALLPGHSHCQLLIAFSMQ